MHIFSRCTYVRSYTCVYVQHACIYMCRSHLGVLSWFLACGFPGGQASLICREDGGRFFNPDWSMSVLGLHGGLAELEQLHVESNIERSRHLCIQHFRIHTSEHMVRPVCMHDADVCIPNLQSYSLLHTNWEFATQFWSPKYVVNQCEPPPPPPPPSPQTWPHIPV